MKNKGVILDRDGTINEDAGYVYRVQDFRFKAGAPEAIRMLVDHGYKVIVITNQSGIGRGYYTATDLRMLHDHINEELAKSGARIDAFYHCPHHPTEALGAYLTDCDCRKPRPGLFRKAIADFDLDVERSYAVGDSLADIEAGTAVGLKTILIGDIEVPGTVRPMFRARDIKEAAGRIVRS